MSSSRVISSFSGSLNLDGSWLAEPKRRITVWPFLISCSYHVKSSVAARPENCTGLSNLANSRTAELISSGFPLSFASWSGFWSSASNPLPSRLRVVSCPATSRRVHWANSSSPVSISPSSSTRSKRLTRSSALCARRSGSIARKYSVRLTRLFCARRAVSTLEVALPKKLARSSDQIWKSLWSSTGIPSISAITLTGRGLANSVINSISVFPATSSNSESTTCWIRGRRRWIMFGVNSLFRSLRIRLCSGGSRKSIHLEKIRLNVANSLCVSRGSAAVRLWLRWLERRESCKPANTSA